MKCYSWVKVGREAHTLNVFNNCLKKQMIVSVTDISNFVRHLPGIFVHV